MTNIPAMDDGLWLKIYNLVGNAQDFCSNESSYQAAASVTETILQVIEALTVRKQIEVLEEVSEIEDDREAMIWLTEKLHELKAALPPEKDTK